MAALSPRELHRLVNNYIGVNGGYLGDFSYRTHAEFYMDLDLDIDPNRLPGTTRARFIEIINAAEPEAQALIIRGILTKYPVGSTPERTQALHDELHALAERLSGSSTSHPTAPAITSPSVAVRHALRDAEELLQSDRAMNALDRVHTALHGYLRIVCAEAGLTHPEDASAAHLLSLLAREHPRLAAPTAHTEAIRKVLRSFGGATDALGTLRNNGTLAHPNEELLDHPEARLAIDCAYALVAYVESRVR